MNNRKEIMSAETKKKKRKERLIFTGIALFLTYSVIAISIVMVMVYAKQNCDDTRYDCDNYFKEYTNELVADRERSQEIKTEQAEVLHQEGTVKERTGISFVEVIKDPFRWGLDGYDAEKEFKSDNGFIEGDPETSFLEYRTQRQKEKQ